MTTFAVCTRRVKPILTPTRTSRVMFDATQRHPAPRDFGRGILRSLPTDRRNWTDADAAWAAQAFGAVDAGGEPLPLSDAELEQAAEWAAALDRLERGLCC
jgi:hypothetical protein